MAREKRVDVLDLELRLGRIGLERIDLVTGTRRPIPGKPGELVYGADFAPGGDAVVLSLAGSTLPADLWRLDLIAGRFQRLTYSPHPGVDLERLVRPELHAFNGHDGLALSGWLYLPPGFEAPGPVVLSFHGGPEAQGRYWAIIAARRGLGNPVPSAGSARASAAG